MQQVSSSSIQAVGYDEDNQIVHVQFLINGRTYIYKGVPEHEYNALLHAPSVGRYFNSNYRNVYPYEMIG